MIAMASSNPTGRGTDDALLSSFKDLDLVTPTIISIHNAVSTARQLGDLRHARPSAFSSTAKQGNTPEVAEKHPTSMAEFHYSEIPTRVKYGHPLKVKRSSIAGAGRGLFTQTKTAEGEMIFSIEKPMLNIVEDGAMSCKKTCDNCMSSSIIWGAGLKMYPHMVLEHHSMDFKVSECTGCHVLHYCSEACRVEAWNHHHKFECGILGEFNSLIGTEGDLMDAVLTTQAWDFRCLLRLLLLHANGKISGNEWDQFRSLHCHLVITKKSPFTMEEAKVFARVLKLATESEVSEEEILELTFAMHQNKLCIRTPVLKCASGVADATLPFFATNGVIIDPFLALINHNCEPNATWVNDGGGIFVRSLKEIPANTEITFSYPGVRGDCQSRQEELQAVWGINCACDTCKQDTPSLKGSLRGRILPLAGLDRLRYVRDTHVELLARHRNSFEEAIRDMKKAGFGYETFPMRELHLLVLYCYMQQGNYTEALKTALKLYYMIDKKQIPSVSPTDHLGMASVLVCVVNMSFQVDCMPLHNVMPLLYYHLKRKYIAGLEKWVGSDGHVVKHEKQVFWEDWGALTRGDKRAEALVELGKSRQERRAFAAKMNKLMEWAGLPGMAEKDFT